MNCIPKCLLCGTQLPPALLTIILVCQASPALRPPFQPSRRWCGFCRACCSIPESIEYLVPTATPAYQNIDEPQSVLPWWHHRAVAYCQIISRKIYRACGCKGKSRYQRLDFQNGAPNGSSESCVALWWLRGGVWTVSAVGGVMVAWLHHHPDRYAAYFSSGTCARFKQIRGPACVRVCVCASARACVL